MAVRGRAVDLAGLEAFVMQRLREDGGFAATPLLGLSLRLQWRSTGADDGIDYEERWYQAVLTGENPAADGGFTPPRWTVKQLYHYLRLQRLAQPGHAPSETEKMVRWLRRCQAPDGGFGFFPHTTSYIENCHWALAALALLDSRPGRPESAAAFILACQTTSGGFSRNSRAAPFLDSSRHAVQGLRHLAYWSGSP